MTRSGAGVLDSDIMADETEWTLQQTREESCQLTDGSIQPCSMMCHCFFLSAAPTSHATAVQAAESVEGIMVIVSSERSVVVENVSSKPTRHTVRLGRIFLPLHCTSTLTEPLSSHQLSIHTTDKRRRTSSNSTAQHASSGR